MEKADVKVTIVVPCYNVQLYIEKCLNSLMEQTYQNIEIICVDDGSVDSTVSIIEEYQDKDNRIKLIQQKNQYAGVARNNGMKQATGEYIIFLDADDYFADILIEKMLESAIENKSDIVLCNAFFYDNETGEINEPSFVLNMNVLKDYPTGFCCEDIPERIFMVGFPVPWNKLYKREFIERNEIEFQNIRRCNDEYFVGISMVLAQKITYVNERLVTYRVNNSKSLQGYGDQKVSFDFYEAYKAIKKSLIDKQKFELVKIGFANKILSSCNALLRKQNNYDSYITLYDFVKQVVFKEMGLFDMALEDVYTNRDFLCQIKLMDAQHYLFEQMLTLRKSGGEKYLFPFKEVAGARNIAIYGAGEVGKSYYKQLMGNSYYSLTAWYDRDYSNLLQKGYNIKNPEDIRMGVFDKVVIAINDDKIKEQIREFIIQKGISVDKII